MQARHDDGGPLTARRIGGVALAILMFLASAALALVAANQVYEASRLLIAVLVPMNPLDSAGWRATVRSLPRVFLVLLMLAWFLGVMVWGHRYMQRAQDLPRLWALFSRTILVEAAVIAVSAFIRFGLPLL
jgi:hypothetical protein